MTTLIICPDCSGTDKGFDENDMICNCELCDGKGLVEATDICCECQDPDCNGC